MTTKITITTSGPITWIKLGRDDIANVDGITAAGAAALREAGFNCGVAVERAGEVIATGRRVEFGPLAFADGLRLRLRADATTARKVHAARREAGVRYGPFAS